MSVVSDTLVENYFINARLSNELYILLLPLPRIVSTLLSALCFLLMMLLAVRLGGFGRRPLAVAAFTAAAVFLLPWIDQLYLVTFQFNYILPMALTLAIFCLAIQPDSKPARHRSTLLFILGLLTGLCHEEYASCAIASLAAIPLIFLRYRNRRLLAALLCLSLGFALLLSTPPFHRGSKLSQYFSTRMVMVYPFLILTAIYLIVSLIRLAKKLLRKEKLSELDPVIIATAVTALLSTGATIIFKTGSRTAVPAIICAAIGLCRICTRKPRREFRGLRPLIRFHHSARSKSRGHTALEYHPHCRLRPRPRPLTQAGSLTPVYGGRAPVIAD